MDEEGLVLSFDTNVSFRFTVDDCQHEAEMMKWYQLVSG